jgi:hypothetical protein
MRLVLEQECEHGKYGVTVRDHWQDEPLPDDPKNQIYCPGGSRIIIDPDNLPDEWIDAAAEAIFEVGPDREFEAYARAALSAALHIDQETNDGRN